MTKKRVLIVGANGMLGGSIFRSLSSRTEYEVLGTVRSEESKHRLAYLGFHNVVANVEVGDSIGLHKIISNFRADFVINCVGLIKQLESSQLPTNAIEINSLFPHRLAQICGQCSARLVHFSTDCVFAGDRGSYMESDLPDARDIYGRSKLLGEIEYQPHLTLRTSIIGHELIGGISLVDWFLAQQGVVQGYAGAFFTGLPTIYVAELLGDYILKSELSGLYHLGVGRIDKFSLLSLIKQVYGADVVIERVDDYKVDRSLSSERLNTAMGLSHPAWPELINKMRREYEKYFL